jgi:2-polyprenyl-6-methoxyphenol hydroxylase-like FAD-dependent oxidoreductase
MTDTIHDQLSVLIVGAGPTGLTAAVELSRLGVSMRIIDKAPERSTTSRALGIQARTVELLRDRGVGEEMLRLGNRAGATALYGRGRRLAAIELHRIPSRYNYILLLAQSETERLLTEQLERQGVKVERRVELVSFAQGRSEEDGVQVLLRGGDGMQEVLDACYLIAADGSHSVARKALGLPFEGKALAQNYALADLHINGAVRQDQLSIFLARNGFLAVFPMGNERFRLMATDPDYGAGEPGDPTLADLQRLYDRVSHIPARLDQLNWGSRFRINSRRMSTLRAGRVFFGGDAAHVHSPAGGQGMNAGIQDMINLSWKLAMVIKRQARPELLNTYETDRIPVIRKLVYMTERATRVFNSTNPVVHQMLTRMVPIALGTSAVQDKVAPMLGQVAAGYRGSAIAARGGRIGRLHAGDRIPDLDVRVAGVPELTRLYEHLDLGRLSLLVVGGDPAGVVQRFEPWLEHVAIRHVSLATSQNAVRGADADVAEELSAAPGLVLVRPDGYVAAAARPADAARLISWLSEWFIARGTGEPVHG